MQAFMTKKFSMPNHMKPIFDSKFACACVVAKIEEQLAFSDLSTWVNKHISINIVQIVADTRIVKHMSFD